MNVETTLAEHGARYGDFTDHAKIAQDLQDAMRAAPNWANLDAGKKQALTVISDKIARILNGDPEYDDNWRDIIGYATLAFDRLQPPALPFRVPKDLPRDPFAHADGSRYCRPAPMEPPE